MLDAIANRGIIPARVYWRKGLIMNIDILLMYVVVSFFYILSPGPAVFLAITNGMTQGGRALMVSSFGNIVALFILSAVSMFGLGAIFMTSATLFMAMKVVGALYLIYIGLKQFRNSRLIMIAKPDGMMVAPKSVAKLFRESFFLAITNPKPILFFTALFPQFLDLKSPLMGQFFVLTGIFMVLSFLVLCSYGMISRLARTWLSDQKRMAWFHRISGGLFILLGIGLMRLKRSVASF
ncbi:LysE family translocator [Terasakiella pusilla]|uniref:LysE family translocator n=1 Tax=Terasakiella pusilla TaxID=64973 RepID=UPI003AA95CC2